MNKRNQRSRKHESGPCLCQGAGPALSDWLRSMGPPETARRHFEAARVEILKGIRALVDARIEQVSKAAKPKGARIPVE